MDKKIESRKIIGKWAGIGIALGCGMGAAMGNIAIGLVLGIVIGAGIGRTEIAIKNNRLTHVS